jgi:hypothetical protein
MSVATMLQPASRASTSSSSSFQPVSRQNTMSSMHDTRSVRASKRMSVTALYLSMSAKDKDLEISDELAKGLSTFSFDRQVSRLLNVVVSAKTPPRTQSQNLVTVQKELCPRKRCPLLGFSNCTTHSKSHGIRGGLCSIRMYYVVAN